LLRRGWTGAEHIGKSPDAGAEGERAARDVRLRRPRNAVQFDRLPPDVAETLRQRVDTTPVAPAKTRPRSGGGEW
jgi:hypothetical protein